MNQNSDSRESVETRQRIQQQTELITALLAEIRELKTTFLAGTTAQPVRHRKRPAMSMMNIRSSSRMRSIVLAVTSGFPLMNVMS